MAKVKKSVTIEENQVEKLFQMGDGNLSKGIEFFVEDWEKKQLFYEMVENMMSVNYMGLDYKNPDDAFQILSYISGYMKGMN